MSQNPIQLRFGELEIPDPCAVPWADMDAHGDVNKHCRQCNHVVHDLTGMSESEIAALYRSLGGKLCGAVSIDDHGKPIVFRNLHRPQKVRLLKHWVAAASLFLLYQTPQAGSSLVDRPSRENTLPLEGGELPASATAKTVTPETNTLVSGLIITKDSTEIHDSLDVEIFYEGKVLMTLQAVNGFFHHDFTGQLKPTDTVTISVVPKVYARDTYNERKYGGAQLATTVGNGQNVTVPIFFWAPPRAKLAGKVMPRSR